MDIEDFRAEPLVEFIDKPSGVAMEEPNLFADKPVGIAIEETESSRVGFEDAGGRE